MDELRLIKRCVIKDKQAWDEFVDEYSRLIYNYIYAILRVKGREPGVESTADIYQGLFLSLCENNFKKLRNYQARNNCSFPSYLRVITINFTLDYLRKNNKIPLSLDEDLAQEGLSLKGILADNKPLLDETVLIKEKYDQLADCIKVLTAQEKYLVQMHIYQGLDMGELAKLFKASRGSLDMRKSRILEKLKNCFRRKKFMLDY
ncbi:MAG: sigma-70 family RNA polymerase sigma factor [Candidatus Omnitrophica bacterium]|nr:sigma-70 family RNA polymerase sigma factor [Candidatus Omnitrophota bacterium]MDD5655027.1 sigma-70 family RNA polymerase sigma factor [Candidatus Omnitrophota bacterium]